MKAETFSDWLHKHAKLPILNVVAMALGFQFLYFCFIAYNRYSEQLERIEQLRESVSIGVQQSNRPLIESAILSFLSNPDVTAVLLCSGGVTQMAYPPDFRGYCREPRAGIREWPIKRPIIGVEGVVLFVLLSPVSILNPMLFWLFVSVVMTLSIFRLLVRMKRRFEVEILTPIMDGLDANVPLAINELEKLRSKNIERTRLMEEKVRMEAMVNLSAQVAHDIRSPVFALDAALKDMAQLPEKQRVIVRHSVNRIRDVANNLLDKNRQPRDSSTAAAVSGAPLDSHLLSSLIDPIITEKRLQFESKLGVSIDFELTPESYGLFARLDPVEFRRMLSNLVNNAVEAMENKGAVQVGLIRQNQNIAITIADNGKGIPPAILAKLGQRGETHGKAGGSGLGLYHAKTTAESWGGTLAITSEPGKGTTVTIELPTGEAPSYFAKELKLLSGHPVVVLDDDPGIHELWRGRFESAHLKDHNIEVFNFSEPAGLRAWVKDNPEKFAKALCLFDYELAGHTETGLSLAEELNVCNRTILITSRAEEKRIIDACAALKIRLIPKGLADMAPISIGEPPPSRAVLLDDSTITQMTWEMAAEEAGAKLIGYTEPHKFMADLGSFPKDMPIYIDSELGEGVKGENIAAELKEKGFTNICLATAHPPERFAHLPWLKVRSKATPWGQGDEEV